VSHDDYSRLIKALTEAGASGADVWGINPVVPFEKLVTREDIWFADAIHINLTS